MPPGNPQCRGGKGIGEGRCKIEAKGADQLCLQRHQRCQTQIRSSSRMLQPYEAAEPGGLGHRLLRWPLVPSCTCWPVSGRQRVSQRDQAALAGGRLSYMLDHVREGIHHCGCVDGVQQSAVNLLPHRWCNQGHQATADGWASMENAFPLEKEATRTREGS